MAEPTKRPDQIIVMGHLRCALLAEHTAFYSLLKAYIAACRAFTASENDIDPETLLVGLQACGLGVRTLCQWLTAGAKVTYPFYAEEAQREMEWLLSEMDGIGVALPDIMRL